MNKDNENIRLPFVGPVSPTEPHGFTPEQMIRCEECLRANPPTRVSCIYCSAALPETESALQFRKPTLRPPDKFETGHNIITLPGGTPPSEGLINAAADLLKLSANVAREILTADIPLPLARIASAEESKLLAIRLGEMGLATITLTDHELGSAESNIARVHSLKLGETDFKIPHSGQTDEMQPSWSDVLMIVTGRIFVRRIEVKERKSRQTENEILDKSEFFSDEAVVDLYIEGSPKTFRIAANGFDFSCLQQEKTLLATENIGKLTQYLKTNSTGAITDESFNRLRQTLETIWAPKQEVLSTGWRRERPGMYTLGSASVDNNENQFTMYSRLRYHFCLHP